MSRPRRNWSQINASLINRGSLHLWISEEKLKEWKSAACALAKRGRSQIYSETAILTCHLVRIAFGLTYRQTQGFMMSLGQLAKIPIPNYTVMCRRFKEVKAKLPRLSGRHPTAIILDSSGLKLFGPGEWLAYRKGEGKRRKWLKLHVALDPASQEVVCAELTEACEGDAAVGARLLERLPKTVRKVVADGAYDTEHFRATVHNRGARAIVPPRSSARLTGDQQRNHDLRLIYGLGNDPPAKRLWKKLVGYGCRSLVETLFSRLKAYFGSGISARTDEARRLEVELKLLIINRFLKPGLSPALA